MSKSGKYWLWSFFVAVVFIAVHGYLFNSSDQEEHLPQVYKLHDAALYKGDYVVESLLSNFSIRFFYVRVVYVFSLLMPVSVTCFVLHLLLITVTAFFIIRTAQLFLVSSSASVAVAFLALVIMNNVTVGGNGVEDNLLTCTVFANAGCMGAWFYFFKKNYVTSFALAGVASLFQLLMGLHVFVLMLLMIFVLEKERTYIRMLFSSGVYLLFASPMLIPILYRQFFMSHSSSDDLFYYVLYVFRNPHHYIPSFFPTKDYLKTGALLIGAIFSVFILKPKWAKEFYVLILLIVGGMLIYFLLLEKFNFLVIGKLQWFKTCTWLTVFCCIAICSWLVQVPVLQKLSGNKMLSQISIVISFLVVVLILNSKYLPTEKLKHRYAIGNYPKNDLTLMHEWINNNCEKDALFVSLPDDDSFLCEAKRPIIVGYKAVIHEPWFMTPWYVEFINTYHLHDNVKWEMKKVIPDASGSYSNYNNNEYLKHKGVKYRIDDISKCQFVKSIGETVFRQGNYLLTRLRAHLVGTCPAQRDYGGDGEGHRRASQARTVGVHRLALGPLVRAVHGSDE